MTAPDPMPLVERLRTDVLWHRRRCNETIAKDCEQAADEIERLTAALEAEKAEVFRLQASHSALYAEVEALRDALAKGVPEGWVPLRIEHEPGHPEDVAFGPQRMMDRLKKWLDKYFAGIVAARNREPLPLPPMRASIFKHPALGDLYDTLAVQMYAAGYAKDTMAAMLAATPPSPAQAAGWRDIESAPRDGSLFLCWVSAVRYGETDEGQQYEEDVSQIDFCNWRTQVDIPDCGWFDPCCGQIGDRQGVTHWMPLPAAPGHPPSEQPINQQV